MNRTTVEKQSGLSVDGKPSEKKEKKISKQKERKKQ
jgi:hypothetical protein